MPALLAGDAPRSENDPDLKAASVAAAASIAMHPVTGTFADPTHELAFAAQFFRLSFGGHVLLMALYIATLMWVTLSTPPEVWPLMGSWAFTTLLGLIGRVLIHQWDDTARAQQMGSWTWTILMVVTVLIDVAGLAGFTAATCEATTMVYSTMYGGLVVVWTVLVNGSHGMGFAHKAGLISALLLDSFLAVGVCGLAWVPSVGLTTATIGVFVVAHLAEMHLRHSYADKQRLEGETQSLKEKVDDEKRQLERRNEQLRAEKERLLYEVQHRGRPLDDGDERSAIRRGLQAGPSQPYHRADSTDSSETGAPAPSDSLPASLPPGPPSTKSSNSNEPISTAGNSSRAVHDKSTVPPPTWAELDAQFYAERAAESAAKQGLAPGAPSSSAGLATALPPPSWAELAYRRFYAERAARSTTVEQGVPPPMSQPPTWAELDAQHYAGLAARCRPWANEQGVELASSEPELAAVQALMDIAQRPPRR